MADERLMFDEGDVRDVILERTSRAINGTLSADEARRKILEKHSAAIHAQLACGAFSADSPKIEAPRGRTSLLTDSKVRVLPAWHVRLELGNVEFSGGKFCRGSGIATGWLAAQTRMVSVVGFAP